MIHVSPERPEEGARLPRAGVTGGCGPPNMGAGSWAGVFCTSSKHS